MTTEIEKQFLNIFEIKNQQNITDEQYLKLFTGVINFFNCANYAKYQTDIKKFKMQLLEDIISFYMYSNDIKPNTLKHQVQAIFKEKDEILQP